MVNAIKETKYVKIKDCYYYSRANGGSYYEINCPFCNFENIAYAWSLTAVGKKCENCKAIINVDTGTGNFKVCKNDLKGKSKR